MKNTEKELITLTQHFLNETKTAYHHREITLQSSLQHHLGLDSLGRAELLSRIEKQWKIQFPDQLLMEAETLNNLLQAIQSAKPITQPQYHPTHPADHYRQYTTETLAHVSQAETLLEVLYDHAQKTPDRPFIFFQNESGHEEILTYSQLLLGALKVANALQERDLKAGETVAIMQPTQLGFFFSFFGILFAAGIPIPIYPPFRPHQLESYAKQEAKILNNAEIRFLITFKQAESLSRLLQGFIPSLEKVITVNELLKSGTPALQPLRAKKENIALIQYTSGSTSAPKGVTLTHHNLLSNIRAFGQAIKISPQDLAVSWLPLYHDFGLIGLVLGSLYYGCPLILLSPITFLAHPEKWLWAIHKYNATLSAAPNFAYEICIRKIEPDIIQGLNLSSWRLAANGAETIYPNTYKRFLEKFKTYGFKAESFCPVYGLAESTVGLTVSPLNRAPRIDIIDRKAFESKKVAIPLAQATDSSNALEIISCGLALPHHAIRIVDDQGQEIPERHIGHLQFQGPSAMQGYYNNPKVTALARQGQWWNSGDYAYKVEGEIFITGREKDIIIKAGRNIYPSVIEEIVSNTPGIRRGCAIAFGIADKEKGTENIILVAETSEKDKSQQATLKKAISQTLSDTLDIFPDTIIFVAPHLIPKTSSGKLQRSACKAMYLEGKFKSVPPWLQMVRLGIKSFALQGFRSLTKTLKLVYTFYVALLLILIIPPFWFIINLLPQRAAGFLCKTVSRLLWFFSGNSLHIQDAEYLTQTKPMIFAANHASYVDAVIVTSIVPFDSRFIVKKEAFSTPLLGDILKKLQHIPIDRANFQKSFKQTKKIETALQDGYSIAIFPEGTFSYASGLRPFKLGAFKIAVETKTPVCPIAIQGSRHILRGDDYLLKPGRVKIIIGKPIYPQGNEWKDVIHLKNQVREFIAAHCGELSLDFSI